MNDIVVCTAVAGAYDHPISHEYDAGVDYIYFTDGLSMPQDVGRWQIELLPESNRGPRRQAKLPKLDPHALPQLEGYHYAVWIDGSMAILDPGFPRAIVSRLQYVPPEGQSRGEGIVLSPHFDGRDDAYGEATIRPPKYADEPLDEQVAFYRSEGFPEHYGLYECGVLARDMFSPKVAELGALWRRQNEWWSYQDQVSLPYCLWKTKTVPDVLPRSFRDYNWIHLNAHLRDD